MKHFTINKDGRDFFVGDIHGHFSAFMTELRNVDFDFEVDRVFSVGDLIDRGPDSVKCLSLVLRPWFHAVRGNHEDMMLGGQPHHIWMMNGGTWANDSTLEELDVFAGLIREFMPLTMTIDTVHGKVGVVHAESNNDWDENSPLDAMDNLWARNRIKYGRDNTIKNIDMVVVGHTPMKEVVRFTNHVYIDTGAAFPEDGGFITLLSIDEVFNK
jgi:serine/threonine protein phosphatase 1